MLTAACEALLTVSVKGSEVFARYMESSALVAASCMVPALVTVSSPVALSIVASPAAGSDAIGDIARAGAAGAGCCVAIPVGHG